MAAREALSTEALSEVTTTSTTVWSDLSVFNDTLSAGDWLALSTRRYAHSSSSGNVDLRLLEDDVEILNTRLRVRSSQNGFYPSMAFLTRVQSAGGPKSLKTQLKAGSTGTARSDDGRIVLLKMGPGDLWAEDLTRITTTSTTFQDAVSRTQEVEAGEYVVIGFAVTDNSGTQAPVYLALEADGEVGPETGSISTVTTAVGVVLLVRRFTLAAGVRKFALKYRAHSSTTAGVQQRRLAVLKAADFDNLYYTQSETDSFGNEAVETEVLSMTPTVAANPHLLLMSCATSADAANSRIFTKIRAGGVDLQESLNITYNAANTRSAANPYVQLATPVAGPRQYRLTRRAPSGQTATHYVKAGAAIAVFDLGADGGGDPSPIAGSLSSSLGSLAAAAAGALMIAGASAATLGGLTATGAGKVQIKGVASQTLAPMTAAGAGALPIRGAGAVTLVPAFVSSSGALPIAATLSATLGPATAVGTGASQPVAAGALDQTLSPLISSASGTLPVAGQSFASLAPVTASSTGALPIKATASASLSAMTSSAWGSLAQVGSGAVSAQLAPLTGQGSGLLAISGAAAPALGSVTSGATGASLIRSSLSVQLASVEGTGAGVLPVAGQAIAALDPLVSSGVGSLAITGTGAATLDPLTASATGGEGNPVQTPPERRAGSVQQDRSLSATAQSRMASAVAQGRMAGSLAQSRALTARPQSRRLPT